MQALPSLKSLRAFEAAARHLSYHAAAEELSVTPAAVKHLVSRLEAALGAPLLQRRGRGLVLTAMGQAGLADLTLGLEYMAAGVSKMRDAQDAQQLIISAEPAFASAWLVPRLAQFQIEYPGITVLIDSTVHVVDLAAKSVDLAIRYGAENNENLNYQRLFDDCIVPACSPDLARRLAEGESSPLSLQSVNRLPLIHWETIGLGAAEASRQWFVWQNWLSHFGLAYLANNNGLRFSDYNQALQAAIAGQGVVLVSAPILSDLFERGLLTCPFLEKASPSVGYDLVTLKDRSSCSAMNAFVQWILSTIENGG